MSVLSFPTTFIKGSEEDFLVCFVKKRNKKKQQLSFNYLTSVEYVFRTAALHPLAPPTPTPLLAAPLGQPLQLPVHIKQSR